MNKSIDQIKDRYKYELKYDADKPIIRINDTLIAKLIFLLMIMISKVN